MIIIAVIALLVFGRRLPDVARSVGKSIVEFKKGLREVKDDIEEQTRIDPPRTSKLEDKLDPSTQGPPAAESSPDTESTKESSPASP